jgi:hypothetical protein
MSGITILNTFETIMSYKPQWSWTAFAIAFVFFLLASIFATAFLINTDTIGKKYARKWKKYYIFNIKLIRGTIIVLITLIGSLAAGYLYEDKQPDVIETRYEVLISDNISFKEFHASYEVLEQRGEIYVIRERDNYEQRE